MNPYLFSRPAPKDIHEFTPKLTNEFDPLYIQSLASEYRNDQLKLHWRMQLSNFGSALILLGHRMQHLAHLPFAVHHASWKTVALHSIKIRNHRQVKIS
jgi:hypothetical protein